MNFSNVLFSTNFCVILLIIEKEDFAKAVGYFGIREIINDVLAFVVEIYKLMLIFSSLIHEEFRKVQRHVNRKHVVKSVDFRSPNIGVLFGVELDSEKGVVFSFHTGNS